MDTKTPPIPLKHQEKRQLIRKQEKTDLSLPPLTGQTNAGRHRNADRKNPGPQWANGTPYVNKEDHQSKRPYRVLHIGATPLMHACQQGDRSRVLRLLREQEDTINYRDRTLRNALHYCMDASTGGAVASAAPELVNAPDAEGHTPLHLAVIAGDTQLVAVLLANGADVNARDLEGHSVLHWATVCGEAECVRLVLAAGAKPSTPDLRGGSPLHYAAQCCGAAVTAELSVPKKVGLKVLHTLLEFGADVNAKDEDGRQPILWAASAGSVEAVLALARAGGSAAAGATDKDGLTALHCAASRGHARCVEALVNLCGSQPDHVDDNGCSALHYAATLGHADATALLLRLGADPNRQDRKGRTPALCAAAKGQLETLKILAQHGGSLHARTVRGTGVAHEAVLSGRIELIEWLARRKPSTLDVATHDGRTPLHVAALHGYLDTCKVLLDHGARINAIFRTSKSGSMTPLDAALYRGNRDCAKLIQMHGGATAQHIRTHRTAPNRVFAAKVKIKHGASSSPSSSESSHHHQEADVYIEERWIEKRTRKHSTPRRREERRDSRSFSEEEVRLSKTSRRDRRRRAKSESARYEGAEVDSGKSSRRKYSKHEYSESSSEFSEDSDGVVERRTHHRRRKSESHDDRSLSDDSLEVVVVRRSVEKKSEKVQYSDKKKKPKETSKETRVTETERSSSRKKSRIDKKKAKKADGRRKKRESSESEEESASTPKRKEDKKFDKDMTDSTSQETVERVVVTALVHKDQAPDTPTPGPGKSKKEEKEAKEEVKSKMDHILEKADEMQSVLMAQAADLKKDVDDIRRQVTEEVPLADENEEDEGDEGDGVQGEDKGRKEEKNDIESNSDDSQREFSRLQSQREEETGGETGSLSPKQEDKDENQEKDEKGSPGESRDEEEEFEDKEKADKEESEEKEASLPEEKSEKSEKSGKSEKSEKSEKSVQSGKSSPVNESESEKDSQSPDSKSEVSKSERMTPVTPVTPEAKREAEADPEKEDDDEAVETGEKGSESSESVRETPKNENLGENLEKDEEGKPEETITDSPTVSISSKKVKKSHSSRPSTAKSKSRESSSKSPAKGSLLESPEEDSPDRSAIVAVIESPEWDEEDDEVAKEIQKVVGDNTEGDTEPEDDDEDDDDDLGVLRVLPSTSEEETPRRPMKVLKAPKFDALSRVEGKSISSPRGLGVRTKQRKDSGGRDSGIEPSPRVSKIPKRTLKCCPNTEKQEALNMETIQRDVQISLRRYHLERKIFFQLMELKRLQIRHGKVNEHILVKRQVETFHKSGMAGPILGVARYDQPLTFRHFEAFLYEQLRRLQRRPASPDWCTEARQCTQKTHRCHHATSAYTSVPIYGYLDGGGQEREQEEVGTLLPRIENRGRGQMTVEVTKGEEKQVISLPAEKLDRTKRYFITFTVRGEAQNSEILNAPRNAQRNTKSV